VYLVPVANVLGFTGFELRSSVKRLRPKNYKTKTITVCWVSMKRILHNDSFKQKNAFELMKHNIIKIGAKFISWKN
jgi:hypothetical protein